MEKKKDWEAGIELRSEKVRKFIGEIPPSLVRCVTVVMMLIVISLIAVICILPYPYSNGESILYHLLGFK